MKPSFLLSIMLFFAANEASAQQGSRDILWLHGGASSSTLWSRAITSAQAESYQFTNVSTFPYENDFAANDIPGWGVFFNDRLATQGRDDVLGIGHDAGGLVLRYMGMMQQETNLTAMILDGVPNQGGKAFEWLLPLAPGAETGAQKIVQSSLDLRTQAQNCRGCQMIEATQRWINSFVATPQIRDFYQQLKPGNPVITNLQSPDIPFAVIWGNEDDDALVLTRLMSSWHNTALFGEDHEYIECYQKEIRQRAIAANQNFAIGLMQGIAGLAGAVGKLNASNLFSIGAAIEASIQAQARILRTTFDLQNELRELLECELVHQALNARWTLAIAPYSLQDFTIEVPCVVSCDQCWEEALNQPDLILLGECLNACIPGCEGGVFTSTQAYLVPEPHDGLLTQSEQSLAGAAKTYEARGSNHLQEQFWEYAPVRNAFVDLFNGNAGAAFVVPR
jgi:pimeloyl-ACP methyl ester carboxylesterase